MSRHCFSYILFAVLFFITGTLYGQEAVEEPVSAAEVIEQNRQRFTVSGFLAFDVNKYQVADKNSAMASVADEDLSWGLNNLNIYLNFDMGYNLRTFLEIRLSFYPGGTTEKTFTGAGSWTIRPYSVRVTDEVNVDFDWGSIAIERAFLEWNRFGFAVLRVGRLLAPAGLYSKDHGPPAMVSFRQPNVVIPFTTLPAIPQAITGFELSGQTVVPLVDVLAEYSLYTGTDKVMGEDGYQDNYGSDKAFGAFLNFQTPPVADLLTIDFGGSFYRGKYIIFNRSETTGYVNTVYYFDRYETQTITQAHLRFTLHSLPLQGELTVQGELQYHWVDENERVNLVNPVTGTAWTANDYHDYVYYVQAQYSMWGRVTPYFRLEENNVNTNYVKQLTGHTFYSYTAGVNLKPLTPLVLKFEYSYYNCADNANNFHNYKIQITSTF